MPLTQDTLERHWNRAISGVSANASRAPSRASTFTPLSTTDVVMMCAPRDESDARCGLGERRSAIGGLRAEGRGDLDDDVGGDAA